MTIEEMKSRKKELGYSNKRLSEESGVPVGTIQKIFSGETNSPRYDTVQALERVLCYANAFGRFMNADELGEPTAAYNYDADQSRGQTTKNVGQAGDKRRCEIGYLPGETGRKRALDVKYYDGEWTIGEYLAFPEGTRVELIDGRFYDMAAPTTIHQTIGLEIGTILKNYVRNNNGNCVPFVAPTDVQLDCDNKTMVQPDVLVVCDRKKITKERIVGAPDFVVEIVSPSNAVIDVLIKLQKYKNAGVREYWIVFPDHKSVMVYDFAKEQNQKIYSFEDTIPVGIWDGKCEVDFKYIYSQVEYMYED